MKPIAQTLALHMAMSGAVLAADVIPQAQVPNWVSQQAIPTDFTRKDRADGVVYLLVDEQENLRNDQEASYYRYAKKAVSPAGVERISQITIDFDPHYQSVALHELYVLRGGERIDLMPTMEVKRLQREEDLERLLYSGEESFHIIANDVQVDDIVIYSFTVAGRNPVFGEEVDSYLSVGWGVPVISTHARVLFDNDDALVVKRLGDNAHGELTHHSHETHQEYVFKDDRRRYRYYEEDQPSWYDPYPYIYASSYHNWGDVVQWALPYYQPSQKGTRYKTKLAELKAVRGKTTQIAQAINFVQDEIRYFGMENGIGSHAPRQPEQILRQGYGDCKDKTLLLVSLLQGLGIEAYPALVSTTFSDKMDEQEPGHAIFNHVIAYFEYEGKPYWVDPTNYLQSTDIDTLFQANYGFGLIIRDDEQSLTAMDSTRRNAINVNTDLVVQAEDGGQMTVTTVYEGRSAERLRRRFANNGIEQISEDYEEYYQEYYEELYARDELEFEDDRAANVVTVVERYQIDEIWEPGDEELVLSVYGELIDGYLVAPKRVKRDSPYWVGGPVELNQAINLTMPMPWPYNKEQVEITNNQMDYRFQISPVEPTLLEKVRKEYNAFELMYHLTLKERSVSVSDFPTYHQSVEEANENWSYVFSYAGSIEEMEDEMRSVENKKTSK
ncbi:DUF3857 domain-containing protein [Thaumasiovibrio subtropicus]|uniref:DUF3857 domain-containing protein n=1 Tax=Thaumasiovibrio subtropicus TaxID=1891207 RepID=UPI00131AD0DA|nr:DUF3857 domain-containing protein [Thaumasiovibrio subtropicus]